VRLSAKVPSGVLIGMKSLPSDANANTEPPQPRSFRDKMKFFEQEIKEQEDKPAKAAKQFSYLAEHEIAKLKQEEATKTANMSEEQLRTYVASGVADMVPDHNLDHVLSSLNTRSSGVVRTLKAENRQQGNLPLNDGGTTLSSSIDPRELEAQKRASWRKARMKSLETDAVHAQAVIAKAQEMSRGPAFNTVDIAFADDDDHHQNHNGNSQAH